MPPLCLLNHFKTMGRGRGPEMARGHRMRAAGLYLLVGIQCMGTRPDVVYPRGRVAVHVDAGVADGYAD